MSRGLNLAMPASTGCVARQNGTGLLAFGLAGIQPCLLQVITKGTGEKCKTEERLSREFCRAASTGRRVVNKFSSPPMVTVICQMMTGDFFRRL
ncbi:MAG: hypothetical protein LBR26_10070, partial [Prevotella sp.]|nr:hypothetical protein [Prevotella sp.]